MYLILRNKTESDLRRPQNVSVIGDVIPEVSTVPEYSHQMERELMSSMNKKVLELFYHKSFGKHTVQNK